MYFSVNYENQSKLLRNKLAGITVHILDVAENDVFLKNFYTSSEGLQKNQQKIKCSRMERIMNDEL